HPAGKGRAPGLVLTPFESGNRGGILLVVVSGLAVPQLAVRDFDHTFNIHTKTSRTRYLNRHPVNPRVHGGIPGSVDGKAVYRLGGIAYGDEHAGDRGARGQQHHGGCREEPTRERDRGRGTVIFGYRLVEL